MLGTFMLIEIFLVNTLFSVGKTRQNTLLLMSMKCPFPAKPVPNAYVLVLMVM